MILIITGLAWDPTVRRLSKHLDARNVDYAIVAPTTMEQHSSLLISERHGGQALLRLDDRTIDLADVQTAWLWRSWSRQAKEPCLEGLSDKPDAWSFYRDEWLTFCKGLSLTLAQSGVFCVNPPPFNWAFEEKCCQMLLAAQVGLRIPPTLYTTRLAIAQQFYDEHDGAIIYKPFKSYFKFIEPPDGPLRVGKIYTNRVQAGDLVEGESFIPTPSIFQPYIPKQVELRVVIIGRAVFACAIHSQQSARANEDWRRYDFEHTLHEAYDLPPEIERKLLALMDRMGLNFGSIDLIVTPAGEYVFLEINPNGQFDWIAQFTGLPLYEHLAAMLCAGQVAYPPPQLAEVSHAP
jgi:glutathione synthase/RimK-type ligase-like ATP-grasp enzyme